MIECKECNDYANSIYERGEIPQEEIPKVALDRHILKGCDKKQCPFLEWLEFALENQKELSEEYTITPEWNKGYTEALLDCKERYLATLTDEGTKNV